MNKEHKKSEKKIIEEGLEAIYGGEEQVDFTKMERAKGRFTQILLTVVITLAVVALISWGAYFIYSKYVADTSEESFNVSIEVPEEVVSGQETQIAINYHNPSPVPLASLELDVRLPTTFVVENLEPSPANAEDLIWSIGNLGANADGLILIKGVWVAEVPSSTPIQVLANYRPANFNADFQDIETVYVDTKSSAFDVSFDGPEDATPGETIPYKIEIKNNSTKPVLKSELSVQLPDGFFLESSSPTLEAGSAALWKFEQIEAGATTTITLNGSFAADATGFQYFDVVFGVNDGIRLLTQTKEQGFTDVLGSDLTVQLIVNGSTENVNAGLGDSLRITLAYENSGETELDDISLLLDFQSELPTPIIWNQADLAGGRITSEGILWDTSKIEPLPPGERVMLNMVFPVATTVGSGQADSFDIVAHANRGEIEIRSTPINVSIDSEAKLLAAGRYFTDEGAPLGSGPLPPKVGEKTTYRIYWTIENSLHDLEDVRVSATLPPDVTWESTSAAELGTVHFDASTNVVSWEIDALPKTIDRVQMNFSVSILPDATDVGKFIKLTSDNLLTAKDTVTDSTLEASVESITTELPDDQFAANKGTVVE